jgi:peptidyl-prolyl cis-trans isomerase D
MLREREMLQNIRELTQGWIAGVIISVIILSFALWGIHSYFVSGGSTNVVATVNDAEITNQQLALAFERVRQEALSRHINVAADQAALKSHALKALIDIEVLKQASLAQGFNVSENQVSSFLQSMPEFQVNNQFSLDRFQQVLSSTMLSSSAFLDLIKSSLLIDQPKLGLVFSSFSLSDETDVTMAIVNQERELEYMSLPLSYFLTSSLVIPVNEIKVYYDAHQNEFMTPEQVSVNYLELSLNTLAATMNPSDAELTSYYNDNINTYTQHVKGKSAHVLAFDTVKDKVKTAYIRQRAEEQFADLREKLADYTYEHPSSLDYAAGKLNLVIKTSPLFAKNESGIDIAKYAKVRQVAFSNDVLNSQNNSDLIQLNPETLVVVRVNSHVPAKLLPLANVSNQIENKLKNREAATQAEKFAEDLQAKLQAGANPEQLATSHKLSWNKVGYIGRYSNQADPAILDSAFRLPRPDAKHMVSYGVTKLPNGYAIIALKAVKDGNLPDDRKQYDVFAQQVQDSNGLLEYELYKQSQIKQAKIIIN